MGLVKATASDVDGTRSETKTGIDGTDNRGCKNEDGYEENDWFVSLRWGSEEGSMATFQNEEAQECI